MRYKLSKELIPKVASPLVLLLVAMGVGSIIALASGVNPLALFGLLFLGPFQNATSAGLTVNLAAVLILTGLSASVAFKGNIWNIGGEGQLFLGATGATLVGLIPIGNPTLQIISVLLASVLFGSLWGLIPALLRIGLQIDEVVSTVLLNYIALLLVDFLISGPIRNPSSIVNMSLPIISSAWLRGIDSTIVNAGIFIAVGLSVLIYFIITRTSLGWEIRVLGSNPHAAEYSGISAARTIVITMIISGGLAGLAGGLLITGSSHVLIQGISTGYGYIGIGAGALAALNPIACIPAAVLFAMFVTGGVAAQSQLGVPFTFIQTLIALVVLILTVRLFVMGRLQKWLH